MAKVRGLAEAAALVQDGDILALGGNIVHRCPFAFVRELARHGRRRPQVMKTAGCLAVESVHAYSSASEVRRNTGFAVEANQDTPITPPTAKELAALEAVDPGGSAPSSSRADGLGAGAGGRPRALALGPRCGGWL